ncbi:hypothetical protein Hanom_Chr11g01036251 [Helianthus anomalus]
MNVIESKKSDDPPVVEAERPKEIHESPRHVHAKEQREKVGGGNGPKGCGDQYNKCVGQDSPFSSIGGHSNSRVGDLGLGASLGFKMGKSNCFMATKGRSNLSKGSRSSSRSVGPEPSVETLRQRKRPRSCLEDRCSAGTRYSKEMSSKNPATGFEQFFFDLNSAAPSENPVANRVEDVVQKSPRQLSSGRRLEL